MLKRPSKIWQEVTFSKRAFLTLAAAILTSACLVGLSAQVSNAGEAPKVFPGPYTAYVQEVVDGDSIKAEIHGFPGSIYMRTVRVKGVDTAETRNFSCAKPLQEKEKKLGKAATDFVKKRYKPGMKFYLTDLQDEKYGKRVAAIVWREIITGRVRLDDELLRHTPRIADPYGINRPGKKKDRLKKILSWCPKE